jgi:SAM-dependent methyltransferase
MNTEQQSFTQVHHCRLCRQPIATSSALEIGPFPKAAQYYPEAEEFSSDEGVLLNIVECPGCGLTQLMNEPVDYFRQVITAASLSPAVREQRTALFNRLRQLFPDHLERPKALEIGCADGSNLPLLNETGYVAKGIEYAPHGQPTSCAQNILNEYILDLGPEHQGQYDLLLSFNYLEHQPDASAFLRKCHSLLSDHGKLLLTVPNLDFLLSSKSGHEFVTDHLVYFTANSFETALRINGFSLLDLQIINNQYDIQIVAEKRKPSAILACKTAVDILVENLNQKLREFDTQGRKVAVWGAGHRTLALLSLSQHHLINCIIDSAKFKHYKFAPISHLRILPPETLLDSSCGIDVILVMVPGIYPREVINKIKSLPLHYHAEQFPPED